MEQQVDKKDVNIKIAIMIISAICATATLLVCLLISVYCVSQTWLQALLIVFGSLIFVALIWITTYLERTTGKYKCKHCGEYFVPTSLQYLCGIHVGFARQLKCPHCNKKSLCKKDFNK